MDLSLNILNIGADTCTQIKIIFLETGPLKTTSSVTSSMFPHPPTESAHFTKFLIF